jgi:hypothetical protein
MCFLISGVMSLWLLSLVLLQVYGRNIKERGNHMFDLSNFALTADS